MRTRRLQGILFLTFRRRHRDDLRAACVFLLAACWISTPLPAQDPQARAEIARGAEAMRQGQTAGAEAAFREAVRLAPNAAEGYIDLGLVLGREGKMEEAIRSLQRALTLRPSTPAVHMYLGIFMYNNNQPELAREQLEMELANQPNDAEALMWLGMVDLGLGRPDQAVLSLDKANQITPNDLNILELRGKAHSQIARDSYARMATLQPGNWHVHHVQAQLYADEGKHADAITELQAAIKLQPNNPDLYEELGDEHRSINQMEPAETAYKRGLELGPANPIAMYNLGSIKIENGDSSAGVSLLLKMTATYLGSPVAEYYLGRGLVSMNKDEDAVVWLQKAAVSSNQEIAKRAYYELGRVYRKLHRMDEAQQAIASYNSLRLGSGKPAADTVPDWRKLGNDHVPATAP